MALKVLIVDDSATVRQQVAIVLDDAGYDVIEASDGNEGISAVASHPDLAMVICDVKMPNMDGMEMVTKLKSDPANDNLPIIMLTTSGEEALIKKAKVAGAVGWIVKPYDIGHLLDVVKKLAG